MSLYSFSTRKKKRNISDRPLWYSVLLYCALVLTIWAVWESIQVYVTAGIRMAAYASADNSAISAWWDSFPIWGFLKNIVGAIAVFISAAFSVLAMIVLYGLFQLFELADVLIENSPQALERFIVGLGLKSQNQFTITDSDPEIVQNLKKSYNHYGEAFFDNLIWFKIAAYFADSIFCLSVQPPLNGGWDRLDLFLIAPVLSDIDARAVFSNIVTLFAVESFVAIWFWLRQGKFIFSLSKPNPNG